MKHCSEQMRHIVLSVPGRGFSNTVDMIRVDRVNCRVDKCISLRGPRSFLACFVGKRPRVMVVEAYEPYQWGMCWST